MRWTSLLSLLLVLAVVAFPHVCFAQIAHLPPVIPRLGRPAKTAWGYILVGLFFAGVVTMAFHRPKRNGPR